MHPGSINRADLLATSLLHVYSVTMPVEDNAVNISRRYHHGDLYAALIDAGLRLLATRESEGVSLREMARLAGVSATAVYRHFPDKAALMAALAREGLQRLAAAQRAAALAAGGGSAGFAATGRAYIRFALANPTLFRLVFASATMASAADNPAAQLLRANVAAELPAGADASAVEAEALRAWALVHGLAMLMLDGQVPADEQLIDRLIAGD